MYEVSALRKWVSPCESDGGFHRGRGVVGSSRDAASAATHHILYSVTAVHHSERELLLLLYCSTAACGCNLLWSLLSCC